MNALRALRHGSGIVILLLIAGNVCQSAAAYPVEYYVQENLAADAPPVADHVNALLVNPWGIKQSPNGLWWISLNSGGLVTAFTGQGKTFPGPEPLRITVPFPASAPPPLSTPTGVVVNSTADFIVAARKPAHLIIVTQEGIVAAWNPEEDKQNAVLAVDNSSFAVYTGAAIGYAEGGPRLYAANFRTESIDVFDRYFHQIRLPADAFVDAGLPEGYAPYNVENINGRIYVAYAKQDPEQYQAVRGAGLGFVTVYDANGKLLMKLQSGPEMNAPWGIASAPPGFGKYGNAVLIANSGSGTIAAYDRVTGRFEGFLERGEGELVTIQGLRGIAFEKNSAADRQAHLYFCAAIEEGKHGLFGMIKPGP